MENEESERGENKFGSDRATARNTNDAENSSDSDNRGLDELIEGLNMCDSPGISIQKCSSCCKETKYSKAFVNLYKHLVDNILKC